MDITRIEFTEKDKRYALRLNGDRWDLFGPSERLETFDITSDNYRRVAIRIFEIIFGFIGTYGDLAPYLTMLEQIKKKD